MSTQTGRTECAAPGCFDGAVARAGLGRTARRPPGTAAFAEGRERSAKPRPNPRRPWGRASLCADMLRDWRCSEGNGLREHPSQLALLGARRVCADIVRYWRCSEGNGSALFGGKRSARRPSPLALFGGNGLRADAFAGAERPAWTSFDCADIVRYWRCWERSARTSFATGAVRRGTFLIDCFGGRGADCDDRGLSGVAAWSTLGAMSSSRVLATFTLLSIASCDPFAGGAGNAQGTGGGGGGGLLGVL